MTELSYWEDPYPTFAWLHAAGPVHYSDDLQAWIVTGYAEAQAALAAEGLSSGWLRAGPTGHLTAPVLEHVRDWLMWADPPGHAAARSAVSGLFTRRSVQARSGEIRKHVADRYASFVAAGGVTS